MFQQHLRHIPPISTGNWHLTVDGFVTKPMHLNYNTLRSLPSSSKKCVLACGGHQPDHPMLADAQWHGVSISQLLGDVKPTHSARFAAFHSADGYATSLPLSALEDAIIAYAMNGEPLPAAHGGPARLIVPGLMGYKLPKWLTHIILSDTPVKGFWEQQGWPTEGTMPPTTTLEISTDEPLRLHGIAYASRFPVRVEISIDDGPWFPVAVQQQSPDVLAFWETNWQHPEPGRYTVRARAIADDGTIQPAATQPVRNLTSTV